VIPYQFQEDPLAKILIRRQFQEEPISDAFQKVLIHHQYAETNQYQPEKAVNEDRGHETLTSYLHVKPQTHRRFGERKAIDRLFREIHVRPAVQEKVIHQIAASRVTRQFRRSRNWIHSQVPKEATWKSLQFGIGGQMAKDQLYWHFLGDQNL
jgi:hypothetical protein